VFLLAYFSTKQLLCNKRTNMGQAAKRKKQRPRINGKPEFATKKSSERLPTKLDDRQEEAGGRGKFASGGANPIPKVRGLSIDVLYLVASNLGTN